MIHPEHIALQQARAEQEPYRKRCIRRDTWAHLEMVTGVSARSPFRSARAFSVPIEAERRL
jgi:hypothetical protein